MPRFSLHFFANHRAPKDFMERRVLIVESQNDFALSMATVLRSAGYQTAMAHTAAEAQREMEKRRPDLVVLRAELPDQSGFTLCGQIKKGKWGQNLKVLLLSSDTGEEALKKHRETPAAADGYLVIPFEMGELASISSNIIPPGTPEDAEDDASLDSALSGNGPREAPPPIRPFARLRRAGLPSCPSGSGAAPSRTRIAPSSTGPSNPSRTARRSCSPSPGSPSVPRPSAS
jgi:CheY-like chemotaxis protein